MEFAVIWAWIAANEAAAATILLIISELLGSIPSVKANGIVSFVLLQIQAQAKKKGAIDPTPKN
jgi:hypothetical protein